MQSSNSVEAIFQEKNLTIQILLNGQLEYEIDLERCNDAPQILDALFQIYDKQWAPPDLAHKVMSAMDKASRKIHGQNIQGVYCPFGQNRKVSWKK